MQYSIQELAHLVGISTRTLRWYEQQRLLKPQREANGYRSYGPVEVTRLQHILLYKELGFELKEIAELLDKDGKDLLERLTWQLRALKERKEQINALIVQVERTIAAEEKGLIMSDEERFEAFKQKALDENERKYGKEIRKKYGEESVKAANAKFAALTQEQHGAIEELNEALSAALKTAVAEGDPRSAKAQQVVALHKRWLLYYWPSYSTTQHRGITQMYVDDERFKKYYDDIVVGGAEFLRDAVWAWTE